MNLMHILQIDQHNLFKNNRAAYLILLLENVYLFHIHVHAILKTTKNTNMHGTFQP